MDKHDEFGASPTSVNVDSWLWDFTAEEMLSEYQLMPWTPSKEVDIKVEIKEEEEQQIDRGSAITVPAMDAGEVWEDVKLSLEERKSLMKVPKKKMWWSKEGYEEAVRNLVLIMKEKGAELGRPIVRRMLRKEASKYVRNNGMLDHMLKHMDGKLVMDGTMRLCRRFNSEGVLEYWLEPAELLEVRKRAGLPPYWVPLSVGRFGDVVASSFPGCSDDCKAERKKLWERLELLNSNIQKLMKGSKEIGKVATRIRSNLHVNTNDLQASIKTDFEIDVVVQNGDNLNMKQLQERESRLMVMAATKIPHSVKLNSKKRKRSLQGPKRSWWPKDWYEAAERKLVLLMKEKGAELGHPIMRRVLREEASKHIRNKGMLDHMLKHMDGKIVMDGTMRLRRWYNSDGVMEYWLEPVQLIEVCEKVGVLDPYRIMPSGDEPAPLSFPGCGDDCETERKQLWEQIMLSTRDMEQLLKNSEAVDKVAATIQFDSYNVDNSLQGGDYDGLEWLDECLNGIASYENFLVNS